MAKTQYHPHIYEYLKKYQQDPTSRVFAPLAEAYRKAGLVKEAIEIAREGLKIHPRFIGGRVALARALFDQQAYQEVIDELAPIVQDIPDNLIAQRLLAESYLVLGEIANALGCYKMLLYFTPEDDETARLVHELEAQAYEKGALVLRNDQPDPALFQFSEKPAQIAIQQSPGVRQEEKIKKIEILQNLLPRVERYRILTNQKNRPNRSLS